MTGTPLSTALLIAPVTLEASEQEMRMALSPWLTASAMAWACFWPSSWAGVRQSIAISRPSLVDSSLAAASAPVRAERKTGLVELFATRAIVNFLPPCGLAGVGLLAVLSPELHPAMSATSAAYNKYLISFISTSL